MIEAADCCTQRLSPLAEKSYSVRRATTGSFLAADDAGIKPETSVKPIDIKIIMNAFSTGNEQIDQTPKSEPTTILIMKESK